MPSQARAPTDTLCASVAVKMSVFTIKFKLCCLLSVLVISAGLGAHPIHSQLQVPPEAYLNGVSVEGIDSMGYDPWTQYREKGRAYEGSTVADATNSTNSTEADSAKQKVDPLSLVYYIGSFAALLLFFLVVSCSECCCEKPPSNANRNGVAGTYEDCPDARTPPPPYDDFAPPPYNSLFDGDESNKDKLSVFVVAVHEPHRTPP